jgi:hypothetical protein
VNHRFAGKDAILVYQMVQSSQAMQVSKNYCVHLVEAFTVIMRKGKINCIIVLVLLVYTPILMNLIDVI